MAQQPRPAARAGEDIIVVGGGIVGAATAYFLALETGGAARITVIEADPAYARAATALSAGSIRQQFSSAINIRISQFGIEFLSRAASELAWDGAPAGIGLVERSYLCLAAPRDEPALRANADLQRRLGVDVEILDADRLTRRFPWLSARGLAAGACTRRGEGWFDAAALLQAVRRKARALGVVLRAGRVARLDRGPGTTLAGVTLADGERIAARWIACAAGTWGPALLRQIGLELPVAARKRTTFVFESPAEIDGMPLVVDPSGIWFRPEGSRWLCGLPPQPDLDVDPDDFSADGSCFETQAWPLLAARVPAFEAARCTGAWVGHYDFNRFDQNAFVGPVPAADNLVIASGFSGHGLQQAPAVGRALAEWIVHGRYRTLDLSPLGYARYPANRPLVEGNVI